MAVGSKSSRICKHRVADCGHNSTHCYVMLYTSSELHEEWSVGRAAQTTTSRVGAHRQRYFVAIAMILLHNDNITMPTSVSVPNTATIHILY